jgi:hypothetical protein
MFSHVLTHRPLNLALFIVLPCGSVSGLAKTTAYAGEDEASIRRAFRRRLKSCP